MGFKKRPKKYHVKFPLVLDARDYHEFNIFGVILSEAVGAEVDYIELDGASSCYYAAAFFVEDNEDLAKLVKEWNEEDKPL